MKPMDTEQEAIEAAAAEWLARRDRRFTAEEAVAFARWQMADPRHRAAVAELELVWGALDGLAAGHSQRAGDVVSASPASRSTPAPRRRGQLQRWWPALGMAAAVALVVGAVLWRQGRETEPPSARYTTIVGVQQVVKLSDGSELQLNTDTAVSVRLSDARRQVELERGEVLFRIAKEPARPFVVIAGDAEARVLGTSFVVRVWERTNDIELVVADGEVSFGRNGSANPTLRRAERAVLARNSWTPRVERLDEFALASRLAWQGGVVEFKNTPLRDAVAELNRYHRTRIELADAATGDLPMGGSFRIANLDGFVRAAETSLEVIVVERNNERILLGMRP